MATRQLTDITIAKMKPALKGRRIEISDAVQPALKLRITDTGAKSWTIYFRAPDGRHRRLTLGSRRGDFLAVAAARKAARAALDKIGEDRDPALEKRAARITRKLEAKRRTADKADGKWKAEHPPGTFGAVAEEFLHRHVEQKGLRTSYEYTRIVKHDLLPRWGFRPAGDVAKADVLALLDEIIERGAPVQALRTFARLKTLYRWAVDDRGLIALNPMTGIAKPGKEPDRDRVLDDDELRALWTAWGAMGWPWGPYMRLLLVTAQRKSEVATMRWDDLGDLDGKEPTWTIPRSFTKSDRTHEVPLSPLTVDIVKSVPRLVRGEGDAAAPSPWVFPASRGDGAINGFSKAKVEADTRSSVTGWRLHDLRRTAATGMVAEKVPVDWASRVLNHSHGPSAKGVTAVYNRHDYADEKRIALTRWAARLSAIVEGHEKNNVVALGA